MKKSMLAGAAVALGLAIAVPALTLSAAETGTQLAQAGPEEHGMGRGGGEGMGGIGGMREHEHGWMHRMMDRMARQSPQQRCEERLARRAGVIAYTVTRLNLTAEQRPLWDRLNGILQSNADKERQLCASLKSAGPGGQDTLLDRVSRREQFLSTHLQALQQARPALEQLYRALTPDQKAIADHPFRQS